VKLNRNDGGTWFLQNMSKIGGSSSATIVEKFDMIQFWTWSAIYSAPLFFTDTSARHLTVISARHLTVIGIVGLQQIVATMPLNFFRRSDGTNS
jgi:hypothetical protein